MHTLFEEDAKQAKDAHVGQVKEFSAPSAPSAPASVSSSELAKELEAYEQSVCPFPTESECSFMSKSPSDGGSEFTATEHAEDHSKESAVNLSFREKNAELTSNLQDSFLESLRADVKQPEAHH